MDSHLPLSVFALRTTLDFILESAFIRDCLLAGLNRPWRFVSIEPGQPMPVVGNSIYLSLADELVPAIRAAIDKGCRNVGVLHLGDEAGQCDRSWYPEVDYVIRNYWYPEAYRLPKHARCRKVLWVPNGWRFGIGPRDRKALMPTSARPTPLFFAGFLASSEQWQAERQVMVDILQQMPAISITTNGFGLGLGPAAYGGWLEGAQFALVPRGRAAETIRLFDALELGAIPVSLDHAFLHAPEAMGGAPIFILDSWKDLAPWYSSIAAKSPAELDAMQHDLLDWWADFKMRHQRNVADLIEQSFAAIAGGG